MVPRRIISCFTYEKSPFVFIENKSWIKVDFLKTRICGPWGGFSTYWRNLQYLKRDLRLARLFPWPWFWSHWPPPLVVFEVFWTPIPSSEAFFSLKSGILGKGSNQWVSIGILVIFGHFRHFWSFWSFLTFFDDFGVISSSPPHEPFLKS